MLGLAVRMLDERARGRSARPRALPRVHGRRVPGREPAPAGPARAMARRTRRALRGRRRLPDDLHVHGGFARAPADVPRAVSGRDRRAARGELPLVAAGARRSRTRSLERSAGFDKTLRATRGDGPSPTARALPDADAEVAVRGGRGPAAARRGRRVGGDRRAVPHQRPLGAVRGSVRGGAASRTRCATASFLRRPGPALGARAAATGGLAESTSPRRSSAVTDARRLRPRRPRSTTREERSRARPTSADCAPSPPSTPRRRIDDGDVAGFVAELAAAVLDRARGPGRAADDLPPREGARVRRGVPAAAARR